MGGSACNDRTQSFPIEGQTHVTVGTALAYGSNPPSSGNHYPAWGHWGVHDTPLARGHYVHNLEHGGVALLYKCDAACPEVVDALRALADARPQDPICSGGVRARILITADPDLAAPVAATAWGQTYQADCVDAPSLEAFLDAHYGHGPEAVCADGI
jgi:hypothetical protein